MDEHIIRIGISGKGNLIFVPSWIPEMRFEPLQTLGILKLKESQQELKEQKEKKIKP